MRPQVAVAARGPSPVAFACSRCPPPAHRVANAVLWHNPRGSCRAGEFAAHARRYEIETVAGDVLWVPTWTWHRVDYLPGVASVSASLFHVRVEQIAAINPLFATLLTPNLFKELIGWKTQ